MEAIRACSTRRGAPACPVVFTTVSYDEGDKQTAAAFIDKIPALLTLEAGSRWVEIDPRIAPRAGEPVLNKLFASAFFGTALVELPRGERLRQPHRDRGLDLGLRAGDRGRRDPARLPPVVPREAVGDRNPAAHAANLYDIDTKYGDVVSVDDVLAHLEEIAAAHAR